MKVNIYWPTRAGAVYRLTDAHAPPIYVSGSHAETAVTILLWRLGLSLSLNGLPSERTLVENRPISDGQRLADYET